MREDNMPDFELEKIYDGMIVGIDEAGRGPWAGPVAAGAVIFKTRDLPQDLLEGLNDSKKLSPQKREKMYQRLREEETNGKVAIGIGLASCREIDEMNILQATFLAMSRAVKQLEISPNFALVDGNRMPHNMPCPAQTVVKGDAKSYSIAAASIVAKVYRDRLMCRLAQTYPQYGFEKNAGYGTAQHIEALKKYGVTPEHRMSYKPIKEVLADNE